MQRKHVLVLLICLLCSCLARSAPVGAEVQSWHYDPQINSVILKVVNTSHKDITAFNVSIKETLADGRIDEHEMLREFLGYIIAAKEHEADHSVGAESFRQRYGDGAFHPGQVYDQIVGVQPNFTGKLEVVVDVVTYADGTADATNNDALGRIIEERQATVASQKIITAAIQAALADPNDPNPAMTAAKEIQDRATVWNTQTSHVKTELDTVRLESAAKDLIKTLSSQNVVDKRAALKQAGDMEQSRLTIMSAHATLTKTGGPQ